MAKPEPLNTPDVEYICGAGTGGGEVIGDELGGDDDLELSRLILRMHVGTDFYTHFLCFVRASGTPTATPIMIKSSKTTNATNTQKGMQPQNFLRPLDSASNSGWSIEDRCAIESGTITCPATGFTTSFSGTGSYSIQVRSELRGD